jgi:hypothetical protein
VCKTRYFMQRVILFLSVVCFLAACQPEIVDTPGSPHVLGNVQQFFAGKAVKGQHFTGNSSSAINLPTPKGHKILFNPNSFVTLGGQPVTGNVDIEVRELTTAAEMILSDRPTVSNGKILESGGVFYIRATQNGQELKLAPGAFVKIDLPASSGSMQGMQVFNGQVTPDNSINWELNTNVGNVIRTDTFGINPALFADSLQWLNVDKFINQPQITYTVQPGNCPDIDSTRIFLHLTGRRSIVRYNQDMSTRLIAAPATVIGICVKNGILYTSIFPVNMQNGASATLNFQPATVEALEQKLKQLN